MERRTDLGVLIAMAIFSPLPDGAQVELVFSLGGQVVENRLWFWTDTPPIDIVAVQGLADGVFAWHTVNVLPFLSSDLQLLFVQASDWSADPTPLAAVGGTSTSGGVAVPSHSANVAAFVGFRWPLQLSRGRRNGNFVPGIPKSAVELNTLTEGFRDALFEAYAALIDDARLFAPGGFWRWVVTSQVEDNTPRSEQLFGECIGPVRRAHIRLGQRRKRLPSS